MYKENFASFLKKVPKIYCKVQKRNRKLHSVHLNLVRNELSSDGKRSVPTMLWGSADHHFPIIPKLQIHIATWNLSNQKF